MRSEYRQDDAAITRKRRRHHWRDRMRTREKGPGFPSGIKKIMSLILLFVFMPLLLNASDIKGRFYVSNYISRDSSQKDYQVLSSRLKLYKHENENPGFYFNLDGEYRLKINDFYEDIPEAKVSELWLGYKFPDKKFDIIAGRQYIYQLYNTYIDGLNVKYQLTKGMGLGIFGGLAPDLYDNSFDSKYKSFGIYGFVERENLQFYTGYENLRYSGKTDREYVSFRLISSLSDKVRMNALSSVSRNQLTNNIELENASANISYAHSKALRFQFFYDYYRAIKYFESSKQLFETVQNRDDYFLDTSSQTRTGARVDYRLAQGLNVYASIAYQKRSFDDENAVRYTGGFTKYNLFGFDVSGRYTHIDNFSSKSDEFNASISRNFFNKVDVSVYASREVEKLDIENGFTAGTLIYGSSIYWTINKNYFLSLLAERYEGDDYHNNSLFTQVGYRF